MKGSYSSLEPLMRSCRERRLLVGTGAPMPGRLLLGGLSFPPPGDQSYLDLGKTKVSRA